MKHLLITLSLMCAAPSIYAHSLTRECTPITTVEVAQLFDRWNNSLATKDAEIVSSNYADGAVLLATLSNRPRTTHADIREYFVHFLEKSPHGKILNRTINIACDEAFDVGTYQFDLTDQKTHQTSTVSARYSFIYRYQQGKWLIAHHHSSLMPEQSH